MPRPRTCAEDRVATAVRLPVSVHQRLHQAAMDRDVSANLLITRAVTDFLERLAPAEAALDPSAPTLSPAPAEADA